MSQYIRYPSYNTVQNYANFAAFPASAANGTLALALDTDSLYAYNTTSSSWVLIGGSGGVLGIGTIDGNGASANGLSIAANLLYAQSASATVPGMVNLTDQNFLGNKFFNTYLQTGGTALTNSRLTGSNLVCVNSFLTSVGYGVAPTMVGYRSGGTEASPTFTPVDGIMNAMTARGHDGTAFVAGSKARVAMMAAENWTATANGTYMAFSTTTKLTVSLAERMRIFDDGNISIGNTSSTAKLSVTGTVASSSTVTGTQLVSNVATGTAPLSVTSTTLVPNLYVARSALSDTVTTNANLTGEVTSVGNAATLTNSAVIAKVLTGYTSGAGTVSATDSILSAIQKLNGNTTAISGAVTSVGNVGSNSNAAGASILSNVLTLQPANGTLPGVLTALAQTIGGDKTHLGNLFLTSPATLQLGTTSGVVTTNEQLSNLYTITSPAAASSRALVSRINVTGNTTNTNQARGIGASAIRTVTANPNDTSGLFGITANVTIDNSAAAFTSTGTFTALNTSALTNTGGGVLTINYSSCELSTDSSAITGYKNHLFLGGLSGGTNNAFISDNRTYTGNYVLNFTSTNSSVFAGNVSVAGFSSALRTDAGTTVTVGALDSTVLLSAAAGTIIATLPTAVGITGRKYLVKRTGAGVGTYTVATTSAQTIDGAATYALTILYKYVEVQSDGANWSIIANN